MKNAGKGGLVYSTDGGRMCPDCRMPVSQCSCPRQGSSPAGGGAVRVSRETSGRNGKCVTIVRGLALDSGALAALGRELKAACGSGGTVKDGAIEVQGDHCNRIVALLKGRYPDVKRAGG